MLQMLPGLKLNKIHMKRIVFFAHYDKHNIIDDYVVEYIKDLTTIANKIIFVSSCNINSEEKHKIDKYCSSILIKSNEGYDFGSWKFGMEYIGFDNMLSFDEVIIANDSCFAPIFPFSEMFNKMSTNQCDAWGVTYGIGYANYLQSYFLVFRKKVIESSLFVNFFKKITTQKNKYDYITKYEVGLSSMLIKNNFVLDWYCKVDKSTVKKNTLKLLIKKVFKNIKEVFIPGPFGRPNLLLKIKSILSQYANPSLFNADALIDQRCPLNVV